MASPDKTPHDPRWETIPLTERDEAWLKRFRGMEQRAQAAEAEVVRLRQDNTRLLAEQEGREPTYYIGKLQERVERLREALLEACDSLDAWHLQNPEDTARLRAVASPDKPPEPDEMERAAREGRIVT